MRPLRVAVVCDFLEEQWPSMDLVGELLVANLNAHANDQIEAVLIRPRFVRRLSRFPLSAEQRRAFNIDRALNRFIDYPRFIRQIRNGFDVFHIVDHSYSQLVHYLPYKRTIVTCHDLDTFQSVLTAKRRHRSPMFRAMTKRILTGFQSAAVVSCVSCATRDEVLAKHLLPPERLVVIRNCVNHACSDEADPIYDQRIDRLLGPPSPETVDLLHVSSTVPRKRIDSLLRLLAAVRAHVPEARLIRVGGAFTRAQHDLVRKLQIENSIIVMPYLEPRELAAVYRRATMLLMPSEAEGFGLPVVEAMACGTPVIASDIPALREAGGPATTYCNVGDVTAWSESVCTLIEEKHKNPSDWQARRSDCLSWVERFGSKRHAFQNLSLYRELVAGS
jgi:glycosyltransferase involved in cell wall biosynthesis